MKQWSEADAEHIDVRGLSPPQPLIAIVRLIESVDDARAVVAHLDRDPVMLYPELAERGWAARRMPAPSGEVRLKLTRDADSA
ncbi:MAG: DUF2249 domain-containing protein [Burkholderiaceae bacterium]|nr:DUF2249 domain-containing protein [Burkholderiaceae bacterium]